jgi:hypothetical protein
LNGLWVRDPSSDQMHLRYYEQLQYSWIVRRVSVCIEGAVGLSVVNGGAGKPTIRMDLQVPTSPPAPPSPPSLFDFPSAPSPNPHLPFPTPSPHLRTPYLPFSTPPSPPPPAACRICSRMYVL